MGLLADDHSEGPIAKAIEAQTSKLPSDLFLWAAMGAIGVSAVMKVMGDKHTALFVGQLAAPFMLLGLYNKIVKLEGHDQKHKEIEEGFALFT